MTKISKKQKLTDYELYLKKFLKKSEHKKMFDDYGRQLEISYQLLQLRKRKKLSQQTLAKKVGTTQSNIARMEAGKQNFSLSTLVKLARVFDKRLEVHFR